MANLTIAVDDDVLRRARVRALETGTSVNALLRSYLESYVGADAMASRRSIVDASDTLVVDRSKRTWSRDELHER